MSVVLPALFLILFVALYLWALGALPELVVIPAPQNFAVKQIGRDLMLDTLVYEVSVGAPGVGDVVARRLTVVVDGVTQSVKEFPAETVSFGVVSVPQDAEVVLSLSDVDDAGNYSEPAVVEFVAVDTIPPPQPGAFGVTLVGEVHADRSDVAPVEPEVAVDEAEEEETDTEETA